MKHIFTVHSHITFLSALAAIKHNRLNKEDVLILSNKYKVPVKGYRVQPSYDEVESSIFEKLKNFNYPKAYDNYIKKLTKGEHYIAYIDLMSSGNKVLVTNPKCSAFHFIEEGIVNYGEYDSLKLLTIDNNQFPWRIVYARDWKLILNAVVRIIRGRSLKMFSLPIHPNIYGYFKGVSYYCFSEKAFLNIPKASKVITPFHLIREEMLTLNDGLEISNSCLWLGDTMTKAYGIEPEVFEEALSTFLDNWLQTHPANDKKVFLKFRKGQFEEEIKLTIKTFQSFGFTTEVLPYDTVVEALLIASENVTAMGNGTSLLIYASLMGHKACSLFRRIPDRYEIPIAKDYIGLWDLVEAC